MRRWRLSRRPFTKPSSRFIFRDEAGVPVTTFVLVHGACLGAWCWSRVAQLLAAKQHSVIVPTLTGLGERAHLLNADIDLETHILDIVNTLKRQELHDVVLVGHSYGGMVVSGVAERIEHPIASVVMLDALFPSDRQSAADLLPPLVREFILKNYTDGATTTPAPPAAMAGINESNRDWVNARCTPHPIRCFLQPVTLTGARDRIANKTYIRASGYRSAEFDACMSEARNRGWRTLEIAVGHLAMIDAPAQVADLLMQAS
jgi:pimeloyl-ACP methyl ester carboxylesterase